jgi:hypothetical protein
MVEMLCISFISFVKQNYNNSDQALITDRRPPTTDENMFT